MISTRESPRTGILGIALANKRDAGSIREDSNLVGLYTSFLQTRG